METKYRHDQPGVTRRGFLVGAGAGLAAGVPLAWLGLKGFDRLRRGEQQPSPFTGRTVEDRRAEFALPGPFPGRVVEVRHPGSVKDHNGVSAEAVKPRNDRGSLEPTAAH